MEEKPQKGKKTELNEKIEFLSEYIKILKDELNLEIRKRCLLEEIITDTKNIKDIKNLTDIIFYD